MLKDQQCLNEQLFDSIPHPALLIRKDRKVLAANSKAREAGARVGGYCWQEFCKGRYIPDKDKKYIQEHGEIPPQGTKCVFCLADKALDESATKNNPSLNIFDRVWDTYWKPLNEETYLHYSIDVTEDFKDEKAVYTVLKKTVGTFGQNLFDTTVRSIAEWLGVRHVHIGLIKNENEFEILSSFEDGVVDHGKNFNFECTLCLHVIEQGFTIFEDDVQKKFPDSALLKKLNARGYIGAYLYNKPGEIIGVLCAISEKRLNVPQKIEEVFSILAGRVAVEIDRMNSEKALAREAEINLSLADLSRALITMENIDDISNMVLQHSRRLTDSRFGFVGYFSPETKNFIATTMTRDIWDQCAVQDKNVVFEKFTGLWGWVLKEKKPLITNDPEKDPRSIGIPDGHIPIERFLGVPALIGQELVGMIALANPGRDYTEHDVHFVERFALLYAIAVQRKRSVEVLQRFVAAVNTSADSFFLVDPAAMRFLDVNEAACRTTGYSREELLNMGPYELDAQLSEEHLADRLNASTTGTFDARIFETTFRHKDGSVFPIEMSLRAMKSGSRVLIVAVARDITERKWAEAELRLLSTGIDQAYDSIVITDSTGIIKYVNPGFERDTGYSKAEVIGKNPRVLKSGKHPPEFYHDMWSTLHRGDIWNGEIINKKKNGQLFIEEATINPVVVNGEITHYVAIKRDITLKKELERNISRLKREYESFMRHEIKNMFFPIKGYSELLQMTAGDKLTDKQNSYIVRIDESVDRAVSLIDKLKALQDLETAHYELELTEYPLNVIVHKTVQDFKLLADKHGVVIEYSSRETQSNVRLDVNLIPGVFSNLIKNAIEHVMNCEEQSEKVVKIDMYNDNRSIIVRINNRGDTIPPDKLELFFEKFNSDHSRKPEGTGLGTTYAYLVTTAHGGEISVESNDEDGTTVTVSLRLC